MGQKLMKGEDAVAALTRADSLHTALTHLVLEGGDLTRIAEELARALDCGVAMTSSDGRERAACLTDADRSALAGAGLLEPTGRFRVERIERTGTPVGAGQARLLRVVAAGVDLARLVAVRSESDFDAADVQALERGSIVAALLITREESIAAVENKYRGDFLRDLFLHRTDDEALAIEHAQSFGWDFGRPVVVAVAELDPEALAGEGSSSPRRRTWQTRFATAWMQVTRGIDAGIPSVDFSSEVVTLLPADVDDPALAAGLVDRAVESVRGDRGGGRLSFSTGVSRVAPTVGDLPAAYRQARRAVEIGRRVRGSGSTTWFDQLGLHRLLALVPDGAELAAYAQDVLGPLAERSPEAADLRETLQVLLDTNFNVAEAARAQFFHYNTMRYRVGKLERLLGPVTTDPHLRLDVAVALRALEVTG